MYTVELDRIVIDDNMIFMMLNFGDEKVDKIWIPHIGKVLPTMLPQSALLSLIYIFMYIPSLVVTTKLEDDVHNDFNMEKYNTPPEHSSTNDHYNHDYTQSASIYSVEADYNPNYQPLTIEDDLIYNRELERMEIITGMKVRGGRLFGGDSGGEGKEKERKGGGERRKGGARVKKQKRKKVRAGGTKRRLLILIFIRAYN